MLSTVNSTQNDNKSHFNLHFSKQNEWPSDCSQKKFKFTEAPFLSQPFVAVHYLAVCCRAICCHAVCFNPFDDQTKSNWLLKNNSVCIDRCKIIFVFIAEYDEKSVERWTIQKNKSFIFEKKTLIEICGGGF